MPSSKNPNPTVDPGPGHLPADTVSADALTFDFSSSTSLDVHVVDPTGAHAASAISTLALPGETWNLPADDAQDALKKGFEGLNARAFWVLDANGNPDADFKGAGALNQAVTAFATSTRKPALYLRAGTYTWTHPGNNTALNNVRIVGASGLAIVNATTLAVGASTVLESVVLNANAVTLVGGSATLRRVVVNTVTLNNSSAKNVLEDVTVSATGAITLSGLSLSCSGTALTSTSTLTQSGGGASITGGAWSGSTITVSGDDNVFLGVPFTGTTVLGGTNNIYLRNGAFTLATLGVTGNATVGGALAVTGNTTVGGTLGVTGNATVGALGVTGNTTIGGTLGVTGNTTLTSTTIVTLNGRSPDTFVAGPASAVTGDVVSFSGASGKLVQDSGKLAANLVTGPASATSGNVPTLDSTGKVLADSGKAASNLVTGPGSSGGGNIVSFADGSGKALQDSGVSATSHAGRHVPGGADTLFPGSWGGEEYPVWDGGQWSSRRRATRRKSPTNQTTTQTGWVDISDLTCANLTTGYYVFEASLAYRTGSQSDGAGFRPNYTGTSHNAAYLRLQYADATNSEVWHGIGFDDPPALTTGPGSGTTLVRITGTFAADSVGAFLIQMRSARLNASTTVVIGCCVILEKM